VAIHINDDPSGFTMTTVSTDQSCSYSGTRGQNRDFIQVSGSYNCTPALSGAWGMSADVTPDGFMGHFYGAGIGSDWGRMGGARTANKVSAGTGLNNDLWFPVNEAGWGINILEQGDTIFATLFVYDAQGKSHWYSASQLRQAGPNERGNYTYGGPLYESTGPYYGTSFNPSAVTRRQVGTMSFEPGRDGNATLLYSVDGVQVTKTVSRYALQRNSLAGNYNGHIVSIAPAAPPEAVALAINDAGSSVTMDTTSSRGTCRYTSPVMQTGELRQLSGTFTCSDGRSGSFSMRDVIVQWDGFVGSFTGGAIASGKIEGVRAAIN
jgi:hypothetical protein